MLSVHVPTSKKRYLGPITDDPHFPGPFPRSYRYFFTERKRRGRQRGRHFSIELTRRSVWEHREKLLTSRSTWSKDWVLELLVPRGNVFSVVEGKRVSSPSSFAASEIAATREEVSRVNAFKERDVTTTSTLLEQCFPPRRCGKIIQVSTYPCSDTLDTTQTRRGDDWLGDSLVSEFLT